MNTYHIGFLIKGKTLVVQARTNIDCLSCELWQYRGEHVTTKKELHAKRFQLLAAVRTENPDKFHQLRHIRID